MARGMYVGASNYKVILDKNLTYSSGTTWTFGSNASNEINWSKGESYVCDVVIDGVTYSGITFQPDVGSSWFGVYPNTGNPIFEVYIATNHQFYDYSLGLNTATSHTIKIATGSKDGVARKVKQMYVGVENLARRVKKAYIGVGGVARPFFGDLELSYYGTVTDLSGVDSYHTMGASVGDYALFAGQLVVNAYNKSLTRSTATALSKSKSYGEGVTFNGYALFMGGTSAPVETYDTSLTRSTPVSLASWAEYSASTTVGNYALSGGGHSSSGNKISTVYAVNKSFTRTNTSSGLSVARNMLGATSVGNYALFAGGATGGTLGAPNSSYVKNTVDVYSTSLTRTNTAELTVAGQVYKQGTTLGDYALFFTHNVINAYNTSLTRSTSTALSSVICAGSAVTLGDYALIGGGTSGSHSAKLNVVNAYDKSLTRSIPTGLSKARSDLGSAVVGNYALFAGGDDGSKCAIVDAYTLV